ncbi:HAD family hydrolase [Formosa sp. S-31]|uniref:HAD family hydrolase n=1 Tax=Formosa sp. S-31 TaxID=2790949 RepID=UPI003EBD891F
MKFKGVIFDLDGTLVDSVEDISDAMNQVLKTYNYPTFEYASYKSFIGHGLKNLSARVLPPEEKTEGLIEEVFLAMLDVYKDNCIDKTKPYEGVLELLETLSKTNLKLSVFSNKADPLTKKITKAILPDCFDYVLGLTEESLKKPNPLKAIQVSMDYNYKPQDFLFVGDTSVDMETAKNANMTSVGVSWGFRTVAELEAHGANHIINSPMELLELL